eukprot:1469454-Pyramimonas_sp.AAC.1
MTWRRVRGPATALIGALYEAGWRCELPERLIPSARCWLKSRSSKEQKISKEALIYYKWLDISGGVSKIVTIPTGA